MVPTTEDAATHGDRPTYLGMNKTRSTASRPTRDDRFDAVLGRGRGFLPVFVRIWGISDVCWGRWHSQSVLRSSEIDVDNLVGSGLKPCWLGGKVEKGRGGT